MTETKLNVSVEDLTAWLIANGARPSLPLPEAAGRIGTWEQECYKRATRMLAAEALYEAGRELLRVADATDCDEPMTEQFDGQRKQQGYRIRLNESLSDAQFGMATALVLADGKEKKPWR